ncbi:MAG TPA: DNA-processing protein DprA [Solirubrobacteraceae bacterium]|nr:DNA-processing protein DprA [Solirubrobacteraceae bacterium]
MSSSGRDRGTPGACAICRRRSWLLSALSGPLDFCARDRGRLIELLALADDELLRAVAGRRARELKSRYERFQADEPAPEENAGAICRHRRGYPPSLRGPAAPHMLSVAGGARRLVKLTGAPVVSIVGSTVASDYGIQMARSLARGLAASGVTVAASLADGIAVAAHAAALDAGGASIAVMGGGLEVSCPARRRSLYEQLTRAGCAISELPADCGGRRWGQLAAERIVVELASLTVLVEADDTEGDLAGARIAQALGRTVAAIPGRVTSPLSRGTHALLIDGAKLIRGPRDALELLYTHDARTDQPAPQAAAGALQAHTNLAPRLAALLERVGAGDDTPDKLTRDRGDCAEVLLALSELELMGLLARGDGGRYLPRDALPT